MMEAMTLVLGDEQLCGGGVIWRQFGTYNLNQIERRVIAEALLACGTLAAARGVLGVSKRGLQLKMRKHGLEKPAGGQRTTE